MSTEPSKFDRLPKTLRGLREFNAGKGILLFLIGGLLYVAHAAFIPVALAMLPVSSCRARWKRCTASDCRGVSVPS